jgi:di/tricarboxylate transporter
VALCTPFAISSNAVILGPGGYKPLGYAKFGMPLSVLVIVVLGISVAAEYEAW